MKKKVSKLDKYFLFSWKKAIGIVASWFLAVILHNMIYAFAMYFFNVEFDEAFFFLLAIVVIPVYTIVVLIYSFVWLVINKILKDNNN